MTNARDLAQGIPLRTALRTQPHLQTLRRKNVRILVLHQHYWPEIAPTGQFLQDVCEDLARAGDSVTVVCGQPSYRFIDGIPKSMPTSEVHRGVAIERVPSYIPEKRSIPRRLLHYGSYFSTSLLKCLIVQKPDVALIMSSPPLLLGLSGALLTALRNIPFVYSVQDIYPDVAVTLGVIKQGPLLSATDSISARLYRSAAYSVTLSDGMAEQLAGKGVARSRIEVIPNWADTEALRPLARDNDFARQHRLSDGFVVQYSGNVGLSQGLDHLIDAAHLLRDLPITVVVAGEGNALPELRRKAEELNCRNVRFLPPQPRSVLPSLLASCDVGLVCMKRGVGTSLVPSKLYGLMAAARPVLASVEESTEVARVLRKFSCGQVVTPENPYSLAEGIRSLFLQSKTSLRAMGTAGRAACESFYSRSVSTSQYRDILLRAAAHSGPAITPATVREARAPVSAALD